VQSVHSITKVVSLNPTHGEVYSIQLYVIKFDSHLQQVVGFIRMPPLIYKTDRHDKTEILLNTITHYRVISCIYM